MSTAPPVRSVRSAGAGRRDDRIRVASVPASHVYVRHLAPVRDEGGHPQVIRLPDRDRRPRGRAPDSTRHSPVMVDPTWVIEHSHDFDVYHLQLGLDAGSPQRPHDLVDALRAEGKPLVCTVHQLRDLPRPGRREDDRLLDVLIPAADALVTLTPGAAAEIESRWGRTPRVIPHPHVVDLGLMERIRRRRLLVPDYCYRPFTVGMHVKSLPAGMDPLVVLPALTRAVQSIPGAVLQVNGHRDVLDPDQERFAHGLARALGETPGCVTVRVHDDFSDLQLWDHLAGLDVTVLPYRSGTHSGWLEACRDVGTAVVAPSCGHYREQGPIFEFEMDDDSLDEESLVAAVRQAHAESPAAAVSVAERVEQRQRIAFAHADLYEELLGR